MNESGLMFMLLARRVILIYPPESLWLIQETSNLFLPQSELVCFHVVWFVYKKITNKNQLWWFLRCKCLEKKKSMSDFSSSDHFHTENVVVHSCVQDVTLDIIVFLGHAAGIKLQMFGLTRGACGGVCVYLSQLFPLPLFLPLAVWAVGCPALLSLSALIVSWAPCQIGSRRKLLEELERIY